MASSEQRSPFWPLVIAVVSVLCLVIALPDSYKKWAPSFLKPSLHLGLDLAGGTQLDFRISEDEINARKEQLTTEIEQLKAENKTNEVLAKQVELQSIEEQHANLVEAIRTVLERRINALGVSEATITPSYFGSERHLLVECPGIINVDQCIATVGKTIRLEFKEEFSGPSDDYEREMRRKANTTFRAVTTGTGTLQVYGQDLSNQLGISYFDAQPLFASTLPKGLENVINRSPNDPVVFTESSIQTTVTNAEGQQELREIPGIYLTQVLEPKRSVERPLTDPHAAYQELAKTTPGATLVSKSAVDLREAPEDLQTTLQTMSIGTQQIVASSLGTHRLVYLAGRTDGTEQMTASHILVQYKGADRADATVQRNKEEAKALAEQMLKRIRAGESFDTIARTESDGPSKDKSGSLGVIGRGVMVAPFENVAFGLKQGEISSVVETQFGFHIIRADKALEKIGAKVTYDTLTINGDAAAAKAVMATIEKGEVSTMEDQVVVRGIFFSLEPTGWKDTELNGQRFRSASVTVDPVTNIPVVQIQFDEEGGKLFQELTKNNVGKSIAIFVGGELVSAPTVQNEISGGSAVITGSRTFEEARKLAQDLNTGAIPAPIYLSGQNTVQATLGNNALEQSIFAAAIGLLILCVFMILVYRVLGVVASLALILYVILLIAATKLPLLLISKEHVVLTLAGIAGIILSMGMAVDANVLAFERVKEELKKGKLFKTAVETGFRKAWPSVRDGNFSTLITCGILFMIGTSIIRGFAVTLTIGIAISMFTALVISRWLCQKIGQTPMAERPQLFGIKKQ